MSRGWFHLSGGHRIQAVLLLLCLLSLLVACPKKKFVSKTLPVEKKTTAETLPEAPKTIDPPPSLQKMFPKTNRSQKTLETLKPKLSPEEALQRYAAALLENYKTGRDILRPLHTELAPPKPGDWLFFYGEQEKGQTFEEYRTCGAMLPYEGHRVIYIQPIGTFLSDQRKVLELTAEFMQYFFSMEVKFLPDLPESVVPATAWRQRASRQAYAETICRDVLATHFPNDGAYVIAFTPFDLWADDLNYVFGLAFLQGRVGVWSIYHFGDPGGGKDAFRRCLLRTMKLAVHETGHMFSIAHCTRYECVMCGCNSLAESDRHPLALCPECLPKIWCATQADPIERFRKMAAFCAEQGLENEKRFYLKSIAALEEAGFKTVLRKRKPETKKTEAAPE